MGSGPEKSIIIAAGGTGGHLFPAQALAEEMQHRGIVVDLMTDERIQRFEKKFPARTIYPVPSATLRKRNPLEAAKTVFSLFRGVIAALGIIRKTKPKAVVGFGGYPTFPPLIAARILGVATVIHEQNSVMGRANRMLATIASGIAISFPNTHNLNKKFTRKTRITGNPVRQTVIRWSGSKYTPPGDGNPFNLLIFGGSQGARFLSDVMPLALMRLNTQTKTNMEVVQQCRIEDIERTKKSYDAAGITAHLSDFFDNMPEIIAAASLVIARAGASTITELAIIGRPSILIPLPGAIDNDQLNNAKFIENVSGGWCIQQKDATPLRIANGIKNLLADKNTLVSAAMAAHKVGYPGAAANLADFVEGCMQ